MYVINAPCVFKTQKSLFPFKSAKLKTHPYVAVRPVVLYPEAGGYGCVQLQYPWYWLDHMGPNGRRYCEVTCSSVRTTYRVSHM